MNQLNAALLSVVLIASAVNILAAPTDDNSIKGLYDYLLLNREYAEPLMLEHGMERKGVRSPSMRLRFGRRSDPDVPLITRYNEIENEIEQKSLRSGQPMRLRFGRRNDPGFEEPFLYANEPLSRKAQRTPSVRFRFGKRDSPMPDYETNDLTHAAEDN